MTGLTSNPTIFDHAIKDGEYYDDAIRRRALAGCLWQDRDPSDIGNVVRVPSDTATTWRSATPGRRRISFVSVAGAAKV